MSFMNIKIHFKCFLTLYLFKTLRFAMNVLRISFKKKIDNNRSQRYNFDIFSNIFVIKIYDCETH